MMIVMNNHKYQPPNATKFKAITTTIDGLGLTIKNPSKLALLGSEIMARPTGFEPVTTCLEGTCSIQLS